MILQPWLFSAAYPMLWAERLSQGNTLESRPSRFGPHLPAVPRTKNGGQGGFELEFMTAEVPAPTGEGRAQKRKPDRPTNYLLGRGGSFVTGRAMLR